jgi:hypothetical protein
MARTLGQLRIALLKTTGAAGYDLELLTERINGRYFEILNAHPWTRLHTVATITTVASYTAGTLAITNGLTAVTLTDGTFPAGLSGGRLRVGTDATWYVFTRTGATTGTLDRAYEADTVTAAAFTLWQPIYSLPTDTDIVESLSVPSTAIELDELSTEAIDETDAARQDVSSPLAYARYSDAAGVQRIELWPGPTLAEGLSLRYRTAGTRFAFATDAATEFPDWVDTDCIMAGVEADVATEKGNTAMAQLCEAKFQQRLAAMFAEDCQRMAPITLEMVDRYVVHRVARELSTDRIDRRAVLLRSF